MTLLIILLFSKIIVAQSISAPPDLTEKQLKSARESVLISNRQLTLEAYLSVDYMPTVPATGPRSHVVIYIKSVNKSPIPTPTIADAVWIKSEEKTWSAWLPETSPYPAYDSPDKIDRAISGHPFSPKEVVVVIVRLTYDDKVYFIKAKDVIVSRTD